MKLTRAKLTRLIKEELGGFLKEAHAGEKLQQALDAGGLDPERGGLDPDDWQKSMERKMEGWGESEDDLRDEVAELVADLNEDELQEALDFLRELTGAGEEEQEPDSDDPWAGYESKWKE